jgi:PGF-pre-PGF domain-containing protein
MNLTRIDTHTPNVTINTPVNSTIQRGTITINTTISDCGINNETVYFRIDSPLGTGVTAWVQMYNTTSDTPYDINGAICSNEFVQTYDTTALAEGTYWVTVRPIDLAQNENASGNISLISVDNVYCGDGSCTGTETCSSCPTDCGYCATGGGGAPAGPVITQVTGMISGIDAGQTGTVTYTSPKTNVLSIGIVPTEPVEKIKVVTEKLDKAPSGGPAPSGTVKDYLEITAFNIEAAQTDYIIIEFRVVKTWLTENGFTPQDIVLQRYADGIWTKLETWQVDEDDTYNYFEANSSAFSYFAITAEKAADCTVTGCPEGFTCSLVGGIYTCIEAVVCEGKTCPTGQTLNTVTCECQTPPPCSGKTCPEGQSLNEETCECEEIVTAADYTWYLIGIGAVIIIIVALLFIFKVGQQKPRAKRRR